MKLIDFHTNLSEHHMRIMDSFATREEYGSRRRVLERALELLEALDRVDVNEILVDHKVRRRLIELFNFVLVNGELLEGLAMVATGKLDLETLLEKIREYTIDMYRTAKKVLVRDWANSFSRMAETTIFYHRHLNIIGEVNVDADQQRVYARLNTFKTIPEIPLDILNTLLDVSGYTFDLRLEEGITPIFIITWVPPENYPRIREQREEYLDSRRKALRARSKST